MAPVMHLDLFLSELLKSVSETTSLSFSECSSELFSEVSVPAKKSIITVNEYVAVNFCFQLIFYFSMFKTRYHTSHT